MWIYAGTRGTRMVVRREASYGVDGLLGSVDDNLPLVKV